MTRRGTSAVLLCIAETLPRRLAALRMTPRVLLASIGPGGATLVRHRPSHLGRSAALSLDLPW